MNARKQWGVALLLASAVTLLALVPYFLGYLFAAPDQAFMGVIMNPEDSQSYFAKMLQGYDGHFLYHIPFTPEPHEGALVGVFYVWLGHIARLLGLSLTAMWHLARVFADLFMFLVAFHFIRTFLQRAEAIWTAYALALLGSGLGWLLFLLKQPYWLGAFPVDFKQPEAHLLFTALTFPHVAMGTGLAMLSVLFVRQVAEDGQGSGISRRLVLAAGLINLAIGIVYPFLIYLVAVIAFIYWIYLGRLHRRFLSRLGGAYSVMFAIPVPLYVHYAYTLESNPVFRAWDAQAGTPSFPWPHYVLAYGVMLLLAFGLWLARPSARRQFALLWVWVAAAAFLLYMPLRPQRRFIQGVHVPLSILAAAGFYELLLPRLERSRIWRALANSPRYSPAKLARFVTIMFILFMSLSNFYVLASVSVSAVDQQRDTIFRPKSEISATSWLRENAAADAIVFADYLTGNYVAAHAGQRVILGHWAETFDYAGKEALVARFYGADEGDAWRQQVLDQYHVSYVWYGPREKQLGSYNPVRAAFLRPVYQNQDITIYAVEGR